MDNFEDSYDSYLSEGGNDCGEELARAMYNAGMAQKIEDCLNNISSVFFIGFAQYLGFRLAQESVKCNAGDINIEQDVKIGGKDYRTRLSTITFKAGKKSLEELAREIAKNIVKSNCGNKVDELVVKGVLSGYNIRKKDFDD